MAKTDFSGSLIGLASVAALFTAAVAWNNNRAQWEDGQRHAIAAQASILANGGQLHLGDVIKNPNPECLKGACFQGTILKLPASDTCGVLFTGKEGVSPSGTTFVPPEIQGKGQPWREVANPNIILFCPERHDVKRTLPTQGLNRQ